MSSMMDEPGEILPTYSMMSEAQIVEQLEKHLNALEINHKLEIMKCPTLRDAHAYCIIYGLSPQQYGPYLERFIQNKFNYVKNNAKDCNGDCSKEGVTGTNTEVKVSLGGKDHTKFNFVQIRLKHDCDTYILTAYHLSQKNRKSKGELYIFRIPKMNLKEIVHSHGQLAHGTIKEYGNIKNESVNEHAIRPSIDDECWKALLPFRIQESDL